MTTYTITATVQVDEEHTNCPPLSDMLLCVDSALCTPDNAAYGIHSISLVGEQHSSGVEDASRTLTPTPYKATKSEGRTKRRK
jgi:hypothetical protein